MFHWRGDWPVQGGAMCAAGTPLEALLAHAATDLFLAHNGTMTESIPIGPSRPTHVAAFVRI